MKSKDALKFATRSLTAVIIASTTAAGVAADTPAKPWRPLGRGQSPAEQFQAQLTLSLLTVAPAASNARAKFDASQAPTDNRVLTGTTFAKQRAGQGRLIAALLSSQRSGRGNGSEGSGGGSAFGRGRRLASPFRPPGPPPGVPPGPPDGVPPGPPDGRPVGPR